ncbi:DNA methylase [Mycobacterium phage Rhynn]|nr:DNA methylase [Mycobacterium phage Rhynn]
MNVLSLFAGIGGLELGLERLGMRVVGQVEIDPFCQQVLEKHWPDVPKHDDVRTAVEWWESEERPSVDVICGGFPCQPFSSAGKRLGIADERWGWPWMRDVIAEVGPRFVVTENVARLVKDAEAFSIILRDLHELGFDAEWDVVTACSVGAPHLRKRLFILAYAHGEQLRLSGGVGGEEGRDPERYLHQWSPESEPHRVVDGVPRRVDRNRALGNAVVPQVAEFVGRRIEMSSKSASI